MRAGAFRTLGLRTAALALIVMALCLRAAVPDGFMLAPNSGGLVICTGLGGTATIENPEKAPVEKAKTCAFAAVAANAPPPAPLVISAPVVFPVSLALSPAVDQRPGLGLAAPPPQSTGPPTSLI